MRKVFENSFLLFSFAILLLASSCANTQKITYFTGIVDTLDNKEVVNIPKVDYENIVIQKRDVLQVTVQTLNPETNEIFANPTSKLEKSPEGYVVDENGEINLPLIGKVNVVGLTVSQASEKIEKLASKKYFNEPIVNVRCVNFMISVLGEVNNAGHYRVDNEKVNVLDALGLAGDLTVFARRDKVILIRETGDGKQFVNFDLNKTDFFQSPYFYLKKGDVLYIAPNKQKASQANEHKLRVYQLALSTVTAITTVAILLVNLNTN